MPTCQLIRGRGSPQIYSRVSLLYSIYKSDAALLIDCVARRRALLQLRFLQQLLAQTGRQRQRVGQLQSADANTTRVTVNCAALATAMLLLLLLFFSPLCRAQCATCLRSLLALFSYLCLFVCLLPQHSYSPLALSNTLPNHDKIPIKVAFKYL